MNKSVEELVNKYLSGKTDREEERKLLDICLKDINNLMVKLPDKLNTIREIVKSAS